MFIANIIFSDTRIALEEFRSAEETDFLKEGTKRPFYQIPCLLVYVASIAQTGAIASFCRKLSGLYRTQDRILSALIDQFIDFVADLTNPVDILSNSPLTEYERTEHRKKLSEGELKN